MQLLMSLAGGLLAGLIGAGIVALCVKLDKR